MHQNCRGWGSAPDHAQGAAYSDPDTHDVFGGNEKKRYEISEFTGRVGGADWLCPRTYWE